MTHDEPHRNEDIESAVADIAEEFLHRIERGEEPDVEEYVRRYPKMAEVLGQVLPVLKIAGATDAVWGREGDGAAPDGRVDRVLGDFRILREIGRGGMGVVYEAEQRSLGRRVALKVLPFAAVMDHRQLQRFKMEAQAAAQLHNTNIVPVYSVGCERGVHYYAMQYVDGHSISTVIRELRRLSGQEDADAGSAEGPVSHLANDLTSGRFVDGAALGTNLPAILYLDVPVSSSVPLLLPAPRRVLRMCSRSLAWAFRRPRVFDTPTTWPLCIATSSLPICCWMRGAISGSRISDWPNTGPRAVRP